jgi:hypothetical protein
MRLSQVLSPIRISFMNIKQKREFSIRCVILSTASLWIQSRTHLYRAGYTGPCPNR